MKKFASILAVMALLAFAGMAFAAADGELTIKNGVYSATDTANNGLVSKDMTSLYYVGEPAGTVDTILGVTLTTKNGTESTQANDDKFAANFTGAPDNIAAAFDPAALGDTTPGDKQRKVTLSTYDSFPVDAFQISFDWLPATGTTKVKANGQPTLTVTPVNVCVASDVEFYFGDAAAKEAAGLVGDGYTIVLSAGHTSDAEVEVAISGDAVAGLKAELSKDNKSVVVTADGKVAVGTYQFTIKATDEGASNIALSEDIADGAETVQIANLEKDSLVGVVTVTVKKTDAQELIDVISKDVYVKSNDVNLVINGKVVSPDQVLAVTSGDLGVTKILVVSLDKDLNPESLPAPASIDAKLGQGYEHGNANDPHVPLAKTIDETGTLCTVELSAADAQKLAGLVAGGRGADEMKSVPMHVDVLGKLVKVDAKYTETTSDKSSSGACSMGAGILALAGLALVLRKRG